MKVSIDVYFEFMGHLVSKQLCPSIFSNHVFMLCGTIDHTPAIPNVAMVTWAVNENADSTQNCPLVQTLFH